MLGELGIINRYSGKSNPALRARTEVAVGKAIRTARILAGKEPTAMLREIFPTNPELLRGASQHKLNSSGKKGPGCF